jgi:hypothetical protein
LKGKSTACVYTAEGQVLLQVLNSTSGRPIPSAPIQGYSVIPPCPPYSQTTVTLNTTYTNATGFAAFGGTLGEYRLYVPPFESYFVDAPIQPERTTCVHPLILGLGTIVTGLIMHERHRAKP